MKPIIQRELDALRAQVAGLSNLVANLTGRLASAEARLAVLDTATPTYDRVFFTAAGLAAADRNSIRSWIDDPNGVVSGNPGDIIMDPANGTIWVCDVGTGWTIH